MIILKKSKKIQINHHNHKINKQYNKKKNNNKNNNKIKKNNIKIQKNFLIMKKREKKNNRVNLVKIYNKIIYKIKIKNNLINLKIT